MELMRSADPDRARREFAEATKNRVVAAVKAQQQAAKAKAEMGSTPQYKGAANPETGTSIEELTVEYRMMSRLGFAEKARQVEAKLEGLKETTTKEKQVTNAQS